MSINVDLSMLKHNDETAHTLPKLITSAKELEAIRKKEADVIIEGDLFTYSGVNFKPMTKDELLTEKIDIKSLKLSTQTSSTNKKDDRVIVAFRNPSDPENVIAYKLDKEVVADLKNSFSSTDFFQRKDGILRLNASAEDYVAGWVQDIKENRGYEKADVNGNGRIDKDEEGDLNIGFDHHTDYDYLAEKIVTAHTFVGERIYQKFSDTMDMKNSTNIMNSQALKFEDTIENELGNTIELDKDKDGTITLREGMVDFTPKNKDIEEHLVDKVKNDHDAWVRKNHIVLDHQTILTRDIVTNKITTYEEKLEKLEELKQYFEKKSIEMQGLVFDKDFENLSVDINEKNQEIVSESS